MGILLAALAAAGDEGVKSIDSNIKQQNALDMQTQRAQLETQKSQALIDYKNKVDQQPLTDAGAYLSEAKGQQVPVAAAPVTTLSGNDPTSAFNQGDSPNADGQGLGGTAAEQTALLAQVKALPDSNPDKAPLLAQIARQRGSDQVDANASVEGKTRAPTTPEAMRAAMEASASDGNLPALSALKAQMVDKFMKVGPGDSLIDTATGATAYSNPNYIDKALIAAEAKAAAGGAASAEVSTAQWLLNNGVAKNPGEAFSMARKVPTGQQTGDPEMNSKIAAMVASGDASAQTVLSRLPPNQRLSILAEVKDINPSYKQQDYTSQQKTLNDFATGPQGNSTRAFNVGLAHLDQVGKLADALDNGNAQLVNTIGNKISSWSGGAAPTNFNAAKSIVAAEIVKAVTGSAGALGDREELGAVLRDANSPSQLAGVVATLKGLMIGQLHGLAQQYSVNASRDDFYKKLSPEAQALSGITATTKAAPAISGGAPVLTYDPKTGSFK